jgi:hypothetical protein
MYLKNNMDKVDWNGIFHSQEDMELIEDVLNKIDLDVIQSSDAKNVWDSFDNPILNALCALRPISDKINWNKLAEVFESNVAINFENPMYKICDELSLNPFIIDLLVKYPAKIDWYYLSFNPAAIHLLMTSTAFDINMYLLGRYVNLNNASRLITSYVNYLKTVVSNEYVMK